MSELNATKEDLITLVRERLGSPLPSELPDSAISTAVDSALLEYSRYKPKLEWRQLDAVPSKASYELDDDVFGVEDVVLEPSRKLLGLGEFIDPYLLDTASIVSTMNNSVLNELYGNPSLMQIQELKNKGYNKQFGIMWEFADGVLRFTPAPQDSRKIAYCVRIMRTLEEVPEVKKEVFLLYVLGDCMEVMGRKRNKKITEVPTASGTIRFDSGVTLREGGQKLKEMFYQKLGGDASAFLIG